MPFYHRGTFGAVLIATFMLVMLSSCAPAVIPPTPTPPAPTLTPTLTVTPSPTATPTPTMTPTSTPIPMPEGWTAIERTETIEGRQVLFNADGRAATEIDGEFYPVDAKGCYYPEFYNPENQTDPTINELIEKINGELSFTMDAGDFSPNQRRVGINPTYTTNVSGKETDISDMAYDALLYRQQLCYNSQSGRWEHMIDLVPPLDAVKPDETRVIRAMVGWMEGDAYRSFTYLDEAANDQPEWLPDVSAGGRKASNLQDAFELWQPLINSRDQVMVRVPLITIQNKKGIQDEVIYAEVLNQISHEPVSNDPGQWQHLNDPVWLDWALSEKSCIHSFSTNSINLEIMQTTCKLIAHRYWGEQTAAGNFPGPVIRTITTSR